MKHILPCGDEHFERFWVAYPKHVAKKDALKAWHQVEGGTHLEAILEALQWQVTLPEWLKDGGQFIPYPASYLRAERWTDEPPRRPMLSGKSSRVIAALETDVLYDD